jgi:hypothetical protein
MNIANIDPDSMRKAATLMDWSRYLKASYQTIQKYYKLGAFKGKRQMDRSIIVEKSEIIRWLGIKPKSAAQQELAKR